jgi:hypothetical protein
MALTRIRLEGMDDLPELTTTTFIGIVVAISGNVLISLALNLQKLAHKRIEAALTHRKSSRQHGKNNDDGPLDGTREHGHRGEPSLDENDEDISQTHTGESSENDNDTGETQSSIHFPVTSSFTADYGATSHDRRPLGRAHSVPKRTLFSRLFPAGAGDEEPQRTSLLPVDVVSEESALNQHDPRRKTPPARPDAAEDGEETEYLRSGLWYASLFRSKFCYFAAKAFHAGGSVSCL